MIELGAASFQAPAKLIGKASPQNRLQRNVGKLPGFSIRICRMNAAVASTDSQNVSPHLRIKSLMLARPSGAQYKHAPALQATNMSWTDKSKEKSNN
jgi:hypothetical protein